MQKELAWTASYADENGLSSYFHNLIWCQVVNMIGAEQHQILPVVVIPVSVQTVISEQAALAISTQIVKCPSPPSLDSKIPDIVLNVEYPHDIKSNLSMHSDVQG